MSQRNRSATDRRIFLCKMVGLSVLPSVIGKDCSASAFPPGEAAFSDPGKAQRGKTRTEILLPLSANTEQNILLAARALLAQLYRDPQSRLVNCPTAFLQRHLRLPYKKACQLADSLETIGDWSSPEDNCRTLYCHCLI